MGVIALVAVALAGCEQKKALLDGGTPDAPSPDVVNKPDVAPDGALPPNTTLITEEELKQLLAAGLAFPDTAEARAEQEKVAANREAQDEATIKGLMASDPSLGDLMPKLPPPGDPYAKLQPDGTYRVELQLGGKTEAVTLLGRRAALAAIAQGIRVYPTKANQDKAYEEVYKNVPEAFFLQLGLPNPASATTKLSLAELTALNNTVGKSWSSIKSFLDPSVYKAPTPPSCAAELHAGSGGDRYGGEGSYSPSGIYSSYTWPYKGYLTCVKNQAGRGTCFAFGPISALEQWVAREYGQFVNLSEQGLNYMTKFVWHREDFGDGAPLEWPLDGMAEPDTRWRVYFEDQWSYNSSVYRTESETTRTYHNSCLGYSGTCSDSTHQTTRVAVDIGAVRYYYFVGVDKNPANLGYRIVNYFAVWDVREPAASLDRMKAYLAAGLPIVWAFGATRDFRSPSAAGFVTFHKDAEGIGGHTVHMVAAIDNAELAQLLPQAPPGDGGGYFIIKNSWGEHYADRGYVYLPFDFVSTTSWGAVVVTGATQ